MLGANQDWSHALARGLQPAVQAGNDVYNDWTGSVVKLLKCPHQLAEVYMMGYLLLTRTDEQGGAGHVTAVTTSLFH